MMNKIIYKVTNKKNSKIYIGKTIQKLNQRKWQHYNDTFNKKSQLYFHRAIRKHGKENFEWKIIEKCNSEYELNVAEEWYIRYFKTVFNEYGYNNTKGGDGGYTNSKKYVILNPDGKKLIIQNLAKFCRNNNLILRHMRNLYDKTSSRKQHKGYRCRLLKNNNVLFLINEMKDETNKLKEIRYIITSPEKIEYKFITLIEAEKKLGKSWQFFGRLHRNNQIIKGWKCKRIKNALKGYEKR
jgi:group I intron endonuclease